MNAKISERIKVDVEQLALTTGAQGSIAYDMQNYDRALFMASVFSTLGVSSQVVDLWETSAATVTGTTAAGGKAGIEIGSTVTTSVPITRGCRELLVTPATVTGSFVLSYGTVTKTFTHTTVAANLLSSAWTSTLLYFGSTIDSTSDGSLKAHAEGIKAAVESTKGFANILTCSTPSTVQVVIKCVSNDSTANIGFSSTAATVIGAVAQRCVVGFEIASEDMTSTAAKRYVGVNLGAHANASQMSVVVVREGGRFKPEPFSGLMSS
jgi:hypothetical protein